MSDKERLARYQAARNNIQKPDASDYKPGTGDLDYAIALELYTEHLEQEVTHLKESREHWMRECRDLREEVEKLRKSAEGETV